MKEYSEEYFIYDYDENELLRKVKSYKSAISLASKISKKSNKSIVITLTRHLNKPTLEQLIFWDSDDEEEEYNPPLRPKLFWKKVEKSRSLKAFEDYSLAVKEIIYKKAKDLYYNTDKSIMSDNQFDMLEKQIKKEFPKSKVLIVGAEPKATQLVGKEELPYWMGSMDKIADPKDWKSKGPWLATEKLDGLSLLYSNIDEPKLHTRGNGMVGQNVTHLLSYLNLPKISKGVAIRGELMISKETFKKYSKEFKNTRNMISGLVNSKKPSSALKNADFVCFELLSPRVKPSAQFKRLKTLGFKTPFNKELKSLDVSRLNALLESRKSKSNYDIDGLVIYDDNKHSINESGNPSWAIAFKRNVKDDMVEVEVQDVVWNLTRHGQLRPIIIIEPTEMNGATVRRITGHNAKNVIDNKIGPGAIIRAVRSGGVIPYIEKVIKKGKVKLPKEKYKWDDTKVNLIAVDSKSATSRIVSTMAHGLSRLGVDNIGEGLVSLLVEEGIDSIAQLRKSSVKKLTPIIGPKRSVDILSNLEESLENADLVTLMVASNCFGSGLGTRKIEPFVQMYPKFVNMSKRELLNLEKLPAGWAQSSIEKLASGKNKFDNWLKKLKIDPPKVEKPKKITGRLFGNVYAFSGFRDADLVARIEKQGGKVNTSLTKDVTHLIVKDLKNLTGKIKTAQQRGVKIDTFDIINKIV